MLSVTRYAAKKGNKANKVITLIRSERLRENIAKTLRSVFVFIAVSRNFYFSKFQSENQNVLEKKFEKKNKNLRKRK